MLSSLLLPLSPRLRRTLNAPKGRLLLTLSLCAVLAAPSVGVAAAAQTVAAAVCGAVVLDLLLTRLLREVWIVPDGAALTGLIVALVLSPQEPVYVPLVGGALAVFSKHLLKGRPLRRVHIFNPAALGLVACAFFFTSGQSWWGALPGLPLAALPLLLLAGYRTAERVNKLPQVFAFLITYLGLVTFAVLLTHGAAPRLAVLYRVPFINATLFLAFFMLTDPPTSPTEVGEQLQFGVLVASACYGAFLFVSGLSFLPLGLLAGNLWLAWHRASRAAWRSSRRAQSRESVDMAYPQFGRQSAREPESGQTGTNPVRSVMGNEPE